MGFAISPDFPPDLQHAMRPKRQNTVFISGWIIEFKWLNHETINEQVLAVIIRSDRAKYGGHHTVYFRNDLALRLFMALTVFHESAPRNPYRSLEAIPFERMDEYFLMVAVHGVLYGNDVFATYMACTNLSGHQRRLVDERVEEFKRKQWALRP